MKHIRRLIAGLVTGLALVVALGGASLPAAASGGAVYNVDDTPDNNMGTHCPAASYTNIAAAVSAINLAPSRNNVKLLICPGTYTLGAGQTLSGFTKLTIAGLGGPIITVPPGFTGVAFDIQNSSKVTLSGLSLDANGKLGSALSVGIRFTNTGGTLKNNIVSGWHQPYTGAPPFFETVVQDSIFIDNSGGPQAVTIQKNTVYDSGSIAIRVENPGKTNISKNRVLFSSNVDPVFVVGGISFRAGIALLSSGTGSKITGNQVESQSDLYPVSGGSAYGILIFQTSGTQVKGNMVRGTSPLIGILSRCDSGIPNANANIISGNRLYEAAPTAVSVYISAAGGISCEGHADGNQFIGNKLYSNRLGAINGIRLNQEAGGVLASDVVKGNTFAGFDPDEVIDVMGTLTNPILGPNKVLYVPPTGPLK